MKPGDKVRAKANHRETRIVRGVCRDKLWLDDGDYCSTGRAEEWELVPPPFAVVRNGIIVAGDQVISDLISPQAAVDRLNAAFEAALAKAKGG